VCVCVYIFIYIFLWIIHSLPPWYFYNLYISSLHLSTNAHISARMHLLVCVCVCVCALVESPTRIPCSGARCVALLRGRALVFPGVRYGGFSERFRGVRVTKRAVCRTRCMLRKRTPRLCLLRPSIPLHLSEAFQQLYLGTSCYSATGMAPGSGGESGAVAITAVSCELNADAPDDAWPNVVWPEGVWGGGQKLRLFTRLGR